MPCNYIEVLCDVMKLVTHKDGPRPDISGFKVDLCRNMDAYLVTGFSYGTHENPTHCSILISTIDMLSTHTAKQLVGLICHKFEESNRTMEAQDVTGKAVKG